MKDKYRDFLKNRREILVFLGVTIIVFVAIIALNSLADRSTDPIESTPTVIQPSSSDDDVIITSSDDDVIEKVFALPLSGGYKITREFYDTATDKELAVIFTGTTYTTSNGLSYAKEDNANFNCLAINDGIVTEVLDDTEYGYKVTVDHENGVISRYSSLSQVSVIVNQRVTAGQSLGVSGTSAYDESALNHVHLETIYDGDYIDPRVLMGLKFSEVDFEGK